MKVCLVAAPLEGRSGVYRSARDLVTEARLRGWDWTALLGMRPTAPPPLDGGVPGVSEWTMREHGMRGVRAIQRVVESDPDAATADVVITLITQSDLALARMSRRRGGAWVAYVRGLPWPAVGEQDLTRRVVQRLLEGRALKQAHEVWATTEVLAGEIGSARAAHIVPAGVPLSDRRLAVPHSDGGHVVWAGRMAVDKRPRLFAEAMAFSDLPAVMFGAGPLTEEVRQAAPSNVDVRGWASPEVLWDKAAAFVGTSSREAFGRSAVEAAAAGVPTIMGARYGAAPLLFTEPELSGRFVIESTDPRIWASAVEQLMKDVGLWRDVSDHVRKNAHGLSIARSVDVIGVRIKALLGG